MNDTITKHRLPGRIRMVVAGVGATVALIGALAAHNGAPLHPTMNAPEQVSQNWAGYVVHSKAGQSFSAVSGSWAQPSVTASSGQGYSAFWVGLGGASPQSSALEQVGTSADVVNGRTQYYAWYELVPAPETKLNLAIKPGDGISARVTVNDGTVNVALSDRSTGQSVSKTLHMSGPDTSSAEWIAEAPSAVTPGGRPQILPLANFAKVTFTNAAATAGGHTGAITDPSWSVQETQLSPSAAIGSPGGSFTLPGGPGLPTASSAGATPSSLSDGGSSFSVSYAAGRGVQPATAGAPSAVRAGSTSGARPSERSRP